MKTLTEIITPARALEILQNNTKNRRLDKGKIMSYADQMKNGEWKLTDQGISIADNGILINGQNRLAAIVKSKQPIEMQVTYGLNYDEVHHVFDTGKPRTPKDLLDIHNVKYAGPISSAIRLKLSLDNSNGHYYSGIKPTNYDVLSEYEANKDAYNEYIKYAISYYNKLKVLTKPTICGIYAHLILRKKNEENKVAYFFDQLYGIEAIKNQTIENLRSVLVNNLAQRERMNTKTRLRYIAKTWNAYFANDAYKRLILRENDKIEFL